MVTLHFRRLLATDTLRFTLLITTRQVEAACPVEGSASSRPLGGLWIGMSRVIGRVTIARTGYNLLQVT